MNQTQCSKWCLCNGHIYVTLYPLNQGAAKGYELLIYSTDISVLLVKLLEISFYFYFTYIYKEN